MNSGATIGLYGGIIGGVLGLLGGIYGTYRSYRTANGPMERRAIITFFLCTLLFVSLFLILLFLTPTEQRWLLYLPYALILPLGLIIGVRKINSAHQLERHEANQASQAIGTSAPRPER